MMTNLQSSAFVARTTQLLSSVARLRLLLVMLLTLCSSANMWGADVTFDLTKASYNSSSSTEVVWTSTPVTMKIEKGSSSTNANNYLGGTNSNTRCYSGQVFSVSVSSGYELKTIVITSTGSSYIMPTSGWSNATATSNGSVVTVTANSGATVISVNPGGTKRLTKVEITYESSTPAVPCTVTLNAGSGSCDASVTESSAGDGVTLPTPTLDCGDWEFAGWKTTSAVTTETTTKPILIAAGTYKPTSDITLYAVYQRTEETEGGGSTTHAFGWENADDESKWTISNFSAKGVYSSYKSAGSYAASTNSKTTGYIQYTEKLSPTDISCKYTKATSNTNSSSKFIIQTSTDGSSWTDAATGATMNNVTQGTFKTLSWTGSLSDVYVRIYYTGTNAVRVLDEVSITATGGGGSTTYYHSNPDCITQTTVTLHPNGGTIDGDSDPQEIQTENGTLILPTPTRDGHTFTGWNTNEYGSGETFDAGENTDWNESFTTLYAQWCATLSAPTGLNATPTKDGATIYWNKVTGASGYEISINDENWISVDAGDNPSYNVTGIECGGTSVTYVVRAVGDTENGYCDYSPSSTQRSFETADCDCPNTYSFHYKNEGNWITNTVICFSPVEGATNNYLTDELYLPYSQFYKVAWQGQDQSYSVETEYSGNMPFYHNRDKKFGANPQHGNLGGGKGKFHVYHDSGDNNKYISFIPTGYTLNFGSGEEWNNDQTLYFTPKTSNWDEKEWYTDLVTLTNDQINKQIFVGLQTEVDYVWCEPYSEKLNIAGMRTKTGRGNNWVDGGMTTSYANKTGKFRIYADSDDKNWYVTFVPHYQLKYDANGGTGTMNPMPAEPVSCEDTEINRTFTVAANTFTRDNYNFTGWNTKADGMGQAYAVDNKIVLTGDVILYAQWEQQSCPAYSFHTGGSDVWNTREEDHCFVQNGSTSEWRIDNYIRPNHTHYVVNWQGGKYTNGGSQNATFASRSWDNMPFANVRSATVGQSAYGVKGSLRIYDDSNQENLYISFIPDAYVLKFGTTEYAITQHSGNDYRSEIVEYAASASANYSVSVGVADADGHYVATNHTQEMRHIFLKDNVGWRNSGAKIAIYYWGGSTGWCGFLKTVPGDATLFEGWIPTNATNIKLVRYNSNKGVPGDWNDIWNQSGDIALSTTSNLFTITSWDNQTTGWSAYSSKGKFRMHDDSGDKNWYVHFYPHYVLTYNKNHADATGTGSMEQQSVPKDASSKAITIAECGFARIGYDFVAWNANMNGQGTSYNPGDTYTLNADKTLYAKWTPQQYEIIYNDQDNVAFSGENTTSLPATHTYGTATAIPDGVKTGYTFGGWYDNPDCTGTPINQLGATDYTSDITLYAKWTANTNTAYRVLHYQQNIADDNYTLYDTENFTGTTAATVTPDVKDYTGFKAPSTQTVTIAADGSTVVEYEYTRNSYTLTWDLAGGSLTNQGTADGLVKYGTPLTAPTVTKLGLTFIGWSPEVPATMPAGDVTYTAIWENCIWVETSIDAINEEDVVVVTMTNTMGTYALNSTGGTTSAPPATSVTVTNKEITSTIQDAIMWSIAKDDDNLIFHPITDPSKNLYCNTSNNNNDRVRVGNSSTGNAFVTHKFIIDGSYLKNAITSHYIGIYLSSGIPQDWRGYTSITNIPSQTLKFYKRVCLSEGQYWVKWMVNGQECTEGDQTTMVVEGGQITAIPDDPANGEIGDCADTFMGWSESNLGSTEGQLAPTDLFTTLAEAQELTITENKTFYAVFATAEGSQNVFKRMQTLDELNNASKIAIINAYSSSAYILNTSLTASAETPEESSSKITVTEGQYWTLEKSNSYWKFKNSDNKYLTTNTIPTSSSKSGSVQLATSGNNEWVIANNTCADNGTPVFTIYNASSKNAGLEYNKGWILYYSTDFNTSWFTLKLYIPDVSYSNYVTNCCALAPATNLIVSATTANSATLTWTAPSSTTGITKLQVRNAETDAVVVDDIAVNTTTITITGLTECTSYKYYVVSVGDCEVVSNTVTATPFSGAKTVNYNYNGGTGSPASFTTSCENQKIILPNATRLGYTFNGWFDAASGGNFVGVGGAEYNPTTSPVTLYAHWTETIYKLTHSGSNYTNTENKTSIKSSDTPFALHYTCTGDYGLPAKISITGGGKSWTIGTDYTWEVAADKQSATLTINQTTITADVTITINVATRYTVTFVHNDKGVFSGSEAIEVLSSENTITLPTVTDVSCGFYDTFEGWIVADEDYTESTSKPAGTIYKGGANYTVNSDCTLRALYSKCEGDATQVYRKITTTGDVTDGTYILVANTPTPRVYSGYGGSTYGSSVEGLTADGEDFSTTLPVDAKPITVTIGTGTYAGTFAMYNADRNKYLTYTGSSNTLNESDSKVFIWKLTDGSNVDSKSCPAGVLTPNGFDTRVLQCNTSSSYRFACYENNASFPYVFLYKLIDKCTKYYSTNPSCEKPVGVHIVYNANAVDASMSCNTQDRTYKVENDVNKYPQLASQLQFCTNATREGYTLVGWNTQSNGQGTTYNINQNYYNLPVSGELDGDKWITLNLYAMWKPCIKFNLGNAIGGTGVPDAVVENGGCVLPTPTAEQLGTIPCGYEFYAWSETSVNATQTKPVLFMPGDTYTGSALTLYAVYRWCEGNTGSDTYYFTFIVNNKTYCITQKHNNYDRFVVAEATSGLIFGLENGYLYYLDEGVKTFVYWKGDGTTVTTTTTYPNDATQKTTFVEGDNGTTIVTPAISGRYLQMPSSYTDRAYYTTDEINPTLVEVQTTTCTYATNPTCYTNTNLHFVTNGGTLNYPTDYNETNYQELAIGDDILLPTATFAGEWTFEGWKRGSQLESQTIKPYDPSFYPVTPNSTLFEVDELGDIYFYAVYSKTNDDKQFDPVNGGTYKLFAIGADDTKTYMPIWDGGRGTMSGVTECYLAGDYTITPGTGTHARQYQITCGEYTLGVQSDVDTDLKEVEGTWWNIEHSTSGKGTWRITVVGSSNRALSCLFSTAKFFGNYTINELNRPNQPTYRDMEIGECIYTEYTSTPENIPYITITGAPMKVTSTNGERVYAPTTLHIEAHNFTGERIIHLSATNGFGVDPVQVRTNGLGAYSGDVKVYYEPTADGDGQTITTSVLTASQTGGTNAEKINQTFAAIQGRNMPANFVIAAKWDGHWYALPANCTSSLSSTEGLLIEVDDVDNPTVAKAAPASAKYGLREVIPSRQTDYGQGIVFTERFAEGDKQFALYNGSEANIQVNAQYSNYAQTNPDKYEWIPTTNDFNEYTLTNASTGRNLGLTSGSFGAYTAASNRVFLLPATFYEPAQMQVLKWKANSVIVMYTGAETTATTQVGDNAKSDEQTLANQQLTHGIYELTINQALTDHAGGELNIYIGTNTRVELEIPLIISGEVTASANAHDVVILENSKLTATSTKYSYKDVYVYGGAKLAIPENTELGVNNIILRAGGVATDDAGKNATYQYIYPHVELKGTLTSAVQNIRYEYVTDNDHWYHLVLPFDGSLASIHYPYEYYGDQVKLDNKGSWIIKRYDGATRATGNYDAWKNIEEDVPEATVVKAGHGYIYWGAPKKVTANGVYERPKWGIQRITMLSDVSETIAKAIEAENADKTISGLGSYKNVANNSLADNDQGWNLIGNPYMVNLTGLNSQSLQIGQLIHETDASGNWTGKWQWDDTSEQTGLRYVTIPSDHFETYEAKPMTWFTEDNPMIAGRSFFVQIAGDATDLVFDVTKKAALVPALLVENNDKPVDIETGIILSNETLQDEVNFWIKAGKTNDYEYNADYPKTPNNNNFNIYGVHTNGHLSWVATGPEYAAESMPIGYQVPAAGTYMLSLSEIYNSDGLEALYITDHALSPEVTVDIMSEPYEFSVNQAETNNERFTVSVKVKEMTESGTTGVDNIGTGDEQIHKFIYQDKIYILHHGVIYDATGKRVITINK